jgi:C-terminal processing protease CtpA/Prc
MTFLFDAASRAEVVDDLCDKLAENYVYPEKAALFIQHLRSRHAEGAHDALQKPEEFCHALTLDLQHISRDRHLVVLWRPDETLATSQTDEESLKEMRRQAASRNYGFRKVELLSGNVGLIELSGFDDPMLGGDTAVAAMRFVSNTHALIFDVRRNMGGDGRMVILLCSYLCPGNQWELSGFYSRKVGKEEPSWTMPYVPGPYYENKPVYVLTGPLTFSGGELLAYDLQALERATIVGEVTGGAAHGAEFHRLVHGCNALISYSAPINPITKTNCEAVGVQPDIKALKRKLCVSRILQRYKPIESTT